MGIVGPVCVLAFASRATLDFLQLQFESLSTNWIVSLIYLTVLEIMPLALMLTIPNVAFGLEDDNVTPSQKDGRKSINTTAGTDSPLLKKYNTFPTQ